MAEHGRDKTGALRDDEIKKEMQGELRAERSTRMEEEHELQPPGEDQPEVERAPEEDLAGGTPPGMTAGDRELRSELARHLEPSVYPARRDALIDSLRRNHAPDRLVALAERLPQDDAAYDNVQDVARALGLGVEDHRT